MLFYASLIKEHVSVEKEAATNNDTEAVGGGINEAAGDVDTIETVSEDSSIDEDDIDMLTDADHDKDVFR